MKRNHSPVHLRARRAMAAAALLSAFAAPGVARADSILYIDGGNVWSSRPDGGARIQLTDGGDWHSPTQADDGTFAAVKGTSNEISLFARDGRPLHTISTVATKSGDGGMLAPRPLDLSLTPDGSRIAYAYKAWSCPVASTCGTIQRATMYSDTNVTAATPLETYGVQQGVSDPEWITNDRALVFGGYLSQVDIDPLGGGERSFINWMRPSPDMGDGELTRDGTRMATTWSYGEHLIIVFWVVNGDPKTELPPAQPDEACETTPDPSLSDPSWSPDGSGVAYHAGDGVHVVRFTQFKRFQEGSCTIGSEQVVAPTGSEPDWGPSDPPAIRWSGGASVAARESGPGPGPGLVGPVGPVGPTNADSGSLTLRPTTLRASSLRSGHARLTVDVAHPGTLRMRLVSGTVVLGSVKVQLKRAGAVTVTLPRASAKGLRAARARGSALVTLTLAAKGQGQLEGSGTVRIR